MNGLVPKIRFQKENGTDFPDWEERSLSEIFNITMGQSPDSEHYNTGGLGLPLIQGNADIHLRKTKAKRYTGQFTKSADINDILISVRAPVGEIAIADAMVAIGRGVASLRPKYGHLAFWFQRMIAAETEWKEIQQGGIFPSITGTDLRDFRVKVPTVDEQRKIGNALSAIDDMADSLNKQFSSLLRFKTGLMQKLFSQELRFQQDDGEDFPDWEETVLPEVAQIRKGKQLSKADMKGGIYPVMNGSIEPIGWHNEFNREAGGIAMTEGGDCGQVRFMDLQYWSSGHSYDIRSKTDYQTRFLYFFLQHQRKALQDLSTGGALKNLPISTLSDFPVSLPSADEQQKIADALSAMDAKISAVAREITLMETFKKGLLQQMFV